MHKLRHDVKSIGLPINLFTECSNLGTRVIERIAT